LIEVEFEEFEGTVREQFHHPAHKTVLPLLFLAERIPEC